MPADLHSPSRIANDHLRSEAEDSMSTEKSEVVLTEMSRAEGGRRRLAVLVALLLALLLLMMKTMCLMRRLSSWITITVTCTLN